MTARRSTARRAAPPAPETMEEPLNSRTGWLAAVNEQKPPKPTTIPTADLAAVSQLDLARYNRERRAWHQNLGPFKTPSLRRVLEDLDLVVESNSEVRQRIRPAVAVSGQANLGKTTAVVSYGQDLHRRRVAELGDRTATGDERVPVCYIRLTGQTHPRTLNEMLCMFYGLPGTNRQTAPVLARRAQDAIARCETEVVILDDVHFVQPTHAAGQAVNNHLKHLAETLPCTFVYAGIDLDRSSALLGGDTPAGAQTRRRWTLVPMEPWHQSDSDWSREWRRLLSGIEQNLVLGSAWPGMLHRDLPEYLWARSAGVIGSLMTLIHRGCHLAVTTREEALNRDILERVRLDYAAEHTRKDRTSS
ncbi:TniB protein [Motilibacter rhizosphaerae]|uniref:TniB protein n=1 Tax=Motilibacter rhizosphaerae TaxID=598652 RepID=A0A4Q7NW56_9ACTN|nr:ATP-binding protein [Motilibacter rhizosphaerae]RZS91128.1 TniB protein [Motilibacter rhizosphaerae]